MDDNLPVLTGMRILIVDDTPANVDVLRKTLEARGFNISMAPSGEVALKIVSRVLPDLILLDVMMPGMDGFETCRQLKKQRMVRDIPVIFITAKAEVEDVVKGFAVGGVDYITKPFRQEEVFARVQTHLHLRKTLREKEQLIDELRELKEKFEISSKTDPLTGLPNRRGMQEKQEYEKRRTERNKKVFSLIMADIDHFKKVNDTYGHDAGDQILVQVAQILTETTRKQDVVCRWGGEEFLMLLPETDLQGGARLAENIRSKIEACEFRYNRQDIPVTMSFGVSVYSANGAKPEYSVKQADDCLYQAKSAGRNKVIAVANVSG